MWTDSLGPDLIAYEIARPDRTRRPSVGSEFDIPMETAPLQTGRPLIPANGLAGVSHRRKRSGREPDTGTHEDLVKRQLTAEVLRLTLCDITRHRVRDGSSLLRRRAVVRNSEPSCMGPRNAVHQMALRQAGILGWMARAASSVNHALIETFWSTMQRERLDRTAWDFKAPLASAMFDWIEGSFTAYTPQ